jgi:NRAMP (natural resistance-associated macrophage protein)-like metal ion transporter
MWWVRVLLILAVLGPGFITANVDNDAGGILTYSSAGATYGYTLLWTMIPITIALIVVQEMCARMGAVTGKGLSDLIREEFGLRMTFFIMHGAVPRQQVPQRARVRGAGMAAGREGRLQEG